MSKGCTITETKRKVFRFHETILRFGELIGSLGKTPKTSKVPRLMIGEFLERFEFLLSQIFNFKQKMYPSKAAQPRNSQFQNSKSKAQKLKKQFPLTRKTLNLQKTFLGLRLSWAPDNLVCSGSNRNCHECCMYIITVMTGQPTPIPRYPPQK